VVCLTRPYDMPCQTPRSDCKSQSNKRCGNLPQEHENLRAAVERIASFSPHVLLVERGVARLAQELLLTKGIVLVLNVKLRTLERLARCTGVQVEPPLTLSALLVLPALCLVRLVLPDVSQICMQLLSWSKSNWCSGYRSRVLTHVVLFLPSCSGGAECGRHHQSQRRLLQRVCGRERAAALAGLSLNCEKLTYACIDGRAAY